MTSMPFYPSALRFIRSFDTRQCLPGHQLYPAVLLSIALYTCLHICAFIIVRLLHTCIHTVCMCVCWCAFINNCLPLVAAIIMLYFLHNHLYTGTVHTYVFINIQICTHLYARILFPCSSSCTSSINSTTLIATTRCIFVRNIATVKASIHEHCDSLQPLSSALWHTSPNSVCCAPPPPPLLL